MSAATPKGDNLTGQIQTLAERGYCSCWFGPVSLHGGHCCLRSIGDDECPDHPVTDDLLTAFRAIRAGGAS